MDPTNTAWNVAEGLPELLRYYAGLSYPLLLVIAAAGGLLLVTWRRRKGAGASTIPLAVCGSLLLFASLGGVVLKAVSSLGTEYEDERRRAAFLAEYQVGPEDHWIFVADFFASGTGDDQHDDRMEYLASIVSETLLEEIPNGFPQPKVRRLPLHSSPWSSGVDDDNYADVMVTLNGDELIWGSMYDERGPRAKAFLAISETITPRTGEFHGRAPLKDLSFDADPRRGLQFSDDGHYRLIGMVMLGMALETYHRAQGASGEDRRLEYLKAAKQLTVMQRTVVNLRDDPILSRTVYGDHVEDLLENAQKEAGLL